MTELLSGGNPLRGRARLDLMLRPFNYRQSTAYYDIRDPDVAFRLNAFVGGTAGYRDLLGGASPQNHDELDRLVAGTLLNPSHALFGEASYLLREDPRITDRALYRSVLAAIGAGSTSTARIGAVIGRSERGLTHALDCGQHRPIERSIGDAWILA